jgi:hypothetical protein
MDMDMEREMDNTSLNIMLQPLFGGTDAIDMLLKTSLAIAGFLLLMYIVFKGDK